MTIIRVVLSYWQHDTIQTILNLVNHYTTYAKIVHTPTKIIDRWMNWEWKHVIDESTMSLHPFASLLLNLKCSKREYATTVAESSAHGTTSFHFSRVWYRGEGWEEWMEEGEREADCLFIYHRTVTNDIVIRNETHEVCHLNGKWISSRDPEFFYFSSSLSESNPSPWIDFIT